MKFTILNVQIDGTKISSEKELIRAHFCLNFIEKNLDKNCTSNKICNKISIDPIF